MARIAVPANAAQRMDGFLFHQVDRGVPDPGAGISETGPGVAMAVKGLEQEEWVRSRPILRRDPYCLNSS